MCCSCVWVRWSLEQRRYFSSFLLGRVGIVWGWRTLRQILFTMACWDWDCQWVRQSHSTSSKNWTWMECGEDSGRGWRRGKEKKKGRGGLYWGVILFFFFILCRKLSFIEWFLRFQPGTRLHTAFKTEAGSKVKSLVASLSESEQVQMGEVISRAETLAQAADENKVRLMIDAEQSYFQPAISHIAVNVLMPKYNLTTPTVYNTVQCYLKVSC